MTATMFVVLKHKVCMFTDTATKVAVNQSRKYCIYENTTMVVILINTACMFKDAMTKVAVNNTTEHVGLIDCGRGHSPSKTRRMLQNS